MTIQKTITTKLNKAFSPEHLEVINESFMHNVPEGSESHFKIIIVCDDFKDKMLIARHRLVNKVLQDELNKSSGTSSGAWKHRLRTKGWNYHASPKGVSLTDETNSKEQTEGGIHALALHTMTMEEWFKKGKAADSPECLGGGKSSNEK
jgi:BolA protein